MNSTNQVTLIGRLYSDLTGHDTSAAVRLVLIIGLAVLVHLTVKAIRGVTEWIIRKGQAQKTRLDFVTHQPKFVTITQLIAAAITFIMYFLALGLVLQEMGVNLTGYLASASIVALAVSFGSQGLVQDVVIGLTLIFSDAMDVGDMVEIFASNTVIGRVEAIGLRFTKLRNYYNQIVFIPNRTIANVSRFPQGGLYAYADVQLPAGVDRDKAAAAVRDVVGGTWGQFGAIILSEPTISEVERALGGGWEFMRVHFKIWPGQGDIIQTTFRQQMVRAMKLLAADYSDWQVTVTYRTLAAPKKV